MKIALGGDHAGFSYKQKIIEYLDSNGATTVDLGPENETSCDYPDFSHLVAKSVQKKDVDFGILVCGSANGVAMAANKHKNIRAALCYSVKNAKLSRLHNDANVITLGERLISKNLAFKCINAFLNTKFEGGRHLKRVKKI